MRLPVLALLALLAAGANAQKQRPPAEPPLLVRQNLVSATTLEPAQSLGLPGYVHDATWLFGSVYVLGDATIDAATGELLEVVGDAVRLRVARGAERWTAANAATGAAPGVTAARRLLFADRVVLPRAGGGLVGLDRASGAVVWQRAEVPDALLVADGSLLAAAGRVGGKPCFAMIAIANGAPGCRAELTEMPSRLVPGPRGVALVSGSQVAVHDRTGPRLFQRPVVVGDFVAGRDGWFTQVRGKLESWSRTGEVVWSVACVCAEFENQRLCATPAGDVLVVTFMDMADSGFTVRCHAEGDGALRWTCIDQGLGIAHSKYWHHVQVRMLGNRALVTSQAAGGNFGVLFDATDGGERLRRKWDF
jgi:hypothetical protein